MSLRGGPGSEATADKYRVNVTRERWTCRALGMKRLLLFQCLRVCFYPEKSDCYEGPSREPVRWPQDGSTAVSPSLLGQSSSSLPSSQARSAARGRTVLSKQPGRAQTLTAEQRLHFNSETPRTFPDRPHHGSQDTLVRANTRKVRAQPEPSAQGFSLHMEGHAKDQPRRSIL